MSQFKLQYEADIRKYASDNILSGKIVIHFWEMEIEPYYASSTNLEINDRSMFIGKK